ncbi:MAG TPA: hypothetical protein VE079_17250 [Ensifer sp.]|nr:hypothetical protein [Ensifer sp.]
MTPRLAAAVGLLLAAQQIGAVGKADARQELTDVISREVSGAIARCFKAPKGYMPPYPPISLLLNFRPDGNLDGPPQLGDPPGGDAKRSATTAAVLSAASQCARIENAARFRQDYLSWKTFPLVFRPDGEIR